MGKSFKSLLASAAVLALCAGSSDAADLEIQEIIETPNYAGTISGGLMYTWSDATGVEGIDNDFTEGKEFLSTFGEAAALYRFSDTFSLQGDFAFHSHRIESVDGCGGCGNKAIDQWHSGGVAFWRDPTMGLFGIDGAWGGIDTGKALDVARIGGRGEWFFGEMATIGGGVGYHNLNLSGKDLDGVNFNVFVNFYATEDLAIKAKFDYATFDESQNGKSIDIKAWSFGGEGEYMLRDIFGGGSSVFVGGRYANFDNDFDAGPGCCSFSSDTDHAQVFVGFRSYFVTGGSLANHHRTNTVDNTNTLLERVPFTPVFGGPP